MSAMSIGKRFLLVTAAALVAAAPAFAQRQSLADRVTALEAKANNSQANMELLNRLSQQEGEIRELRAQIEKLQHDLQEFQQRNRDQYLDLDGRLNRLEGGSVPPVAAPPAAGAITPPSTPPVAAAKVEAAPSFTAIPAPWPRPGTSGPPTTRLSTSSSPATTSVRRSCSPRSCRPTPAESMCPTRCTGWVRATTSPRTTRWPRNSSARLMERYPTHDKAPGSLLKLGLCEYGLGKVDAAERTLADVVSRYPGSDVARTADDRLKAIQLGRLR